jgi:uncharacterized protein involved in exopolysaccharide biosynthesis
MLDLTNSKPKDEINLRELFITLWAHKLLIACTCILGIMLGGYYSLNADKKFTSIAIFKLDDLNSNRIFDGSLGAIANVAGFDAVNAGPIVPKDFVNGRVFIEKLDTKLNFHEDIYFNTYNPNSLDPIWKTIIKRAIGWQKLSTDTQEVVWQGIINTYGKNILLEQSKDNTLKVIVTHANPHRAAEIANVIMDEIIFYTKNKKITQQDQQLSYLSNILAKSLTDLEKSQTELKEFTLENSALPLENFTVESLQLDALREQLNRTLELYDAVTALSLMLQNKTTDQDNYLELRQQYPIVDQVDFRRILGQNEIVNSWNWPESSSVNAVLDTLLERKSRLASKLNASQKDAERLSLAVTIYSGLQRKETFAEASYTVLLEQVKAQTMVAGFRPDTTEIYEYATASINHSSPNQPLILAVGAISGLFLGTLLSLLLGLFRGVYYSKESLKAGANARRSASVKTLLPLRNKILDNLNTILMKNPQPILRDMTVEIHKSDTTRVVVTSSRAKLKSNEVARALASYMQSETMKIAVIDFSSRAKKLDIESDELSVGSFFITESVGQISALRPDGNLAAMDLLSQRDFLSETQSLNSTFDLVFLCADNGEAIGLLNALEGQKMFHITIARTKKTKAATLAQMRSLLPIQGLLHD